MSDNKTYTLKVYTKEKMEELKELAKPLVKYLNDNHDPHTIIRIEYDKVTLLTERTGIPIKDYID